MREDHTITTDQCPHVRVRVSFAPGGAELAQLLDESGPLVVRIDDKGRTSVIGGWQGKFSESPIAHAWKKFGKTEPVLRYLWLGYGAIATVVGTPDSRTFAYVVVGHDEWVTEFGGEGDERPDRWWTMVQVGRAAKQVAAYAAGEAWEFIGERQTTGIQVRSYDEDRPDVVEKFTEWEDTDQYGPYLDYEETTRLAMDYLTGTAHDYDCKRCRSHGA